MKTRNVFFHHMNILLLSVILFILFAEIVWASGPATGKDIQVKAVIKPDKISVEKLFVNIGGVRQGMFIRYTNPENPVLLYIHGGPAFPNFFLIDKYEPGLENYFTVCYWEQRGGGLSYNPDVAIESMNFDQLVSDAIEVSQYLCHRFQKEKIFLMAHSGGTPIGILAAARAPELFEAYIGMAQITNQAESERRAYRYMTEKYTASNNKRMLHKLEKYPLLETDTNFTIFYKSVLRDKCMHQLGIGTMQDMHSVFTGVFLPVWGCRAYTLKERYMIWKSKFSFVKKAGFVEELFILDIPSSIPELKLPVYFLGGAYDLTVNTDLAKAYLARLKAPVKGFYTFDHSAHSPLFEEPGRVQEIIVKDILQKQCSLADKIEN
jgi:pimeloyl-ACP methyl ester carboxylesterase